MSGMRAGRSGSQGFNLIEVIFAASLLSLVMLMMFNLYPSSLLTIRQAEHRLEATALAQSILEQLRAGPFSSLMTVLSPSNPSPSAPPNPTQNIPLQYPPMTVTPPQGVPGNEPIPFSTPPIQGLGLVIHNYVAPTTPAPPPSDAWVAISGTVTPAPLPTGLKPGVPVGDDSTQFYPWVLYKIPNTTPATTSNRLISVTVYVQWQEKSDGQVTAPNLSTMWGGDPSTGTHEALSNPPHHEVSQELWICDIKH